MTIKVICDDREVATVIGIADAVIRFFLDETYSLKQAVAARQDLEEFIDYLNAFRRHHPVSDFARAVENNKGE